MSYAKLFASITESTLWSEAKATRILFVSMLARCDSTGFLEASVPGLCRLANLTRSEVNRALARLSGPDKDSKNPEHEGRRIVKVPGGWTLLNYEAYRNRSSDDDRRSYMRDYMRDYRRNSEVGKQPVNTRKQKLAPLGQGEAEAETEGEGTKSTAQPGKPAAAKGDPRFSLVVFEWHERFKVKFGVDYVMAGARDGKALREFLGACKLEVPAIVEVIEKGWDLPPGFLADQCRTIRGFVGRFNEVQTAVKAVAKPVPGRNGKVGMESSRIDGPTLADFPNSFPEERVKT